MNATAPNAKMASIFEKTPFFKVKRTWDEKTKLPETYKLRSNEYGQKQTAEVHTDGGEFGPEFTISRTIPDFLRGAEKTNLTYEQSLGEFQNVFRGPLLTDWNHVLATNYPEPVEPEFVLPEHDRSSAANFKRAIDEFIKRHLKEKKPRDRQYIYMAPGGDYSVHKELLVTPMDHLHRFEEMLRIAELMPAGDIPPPNPALQVEWFYMTFHKSDRSEYVRSGRKLDEETASSVAEYFERLHNARLHDGSLQKKRDEQIRRTAKSELRHDLEERYKRKLHDFERSRARSANRTWHRERDNNRDRRGGYNDKRATNKDSRGGGERKAPPEGSAKTACHLHGPDSKHSYSECRQNPKNRGSNNDNNNYVKKRSHDAHYHDDRRHSSGDDESHESSNPALSEGEESERESRDGTPAENYHLDNYHIPKKVQRMDDVGHKSPRSKNAVVTCGAVVNRTAKKDKKSSSSARMASFSEPNLNFEELFPDSMSINSVVGTPVDEEEPGLSVHDDLEAFDFGN